MEQKTNIEMEISDPSTEYRLTGTSLQGHIQCSYDHIVKILGEPNEPTDDYKTDACWSINTPEGIATIYNWKDGRNYLGEDGQDVKDIINWNIGGKKKEVVDIVKSVLEIKEQNQKLL